MMGPAKTVTTILAVAALAGGLASCEKQEVAEEKGPAERAGQQIDQAAARAGEELNKVAEKAGKGLAKVGEKLQNAAQEAQDRQEETQKKE